LGDEGGRRVIQRPVDIDRTIVANDIGHQNKLLAARAHQEHVYGYREDMVESRNCDCHVRYWIGHRSYRDV
jgi:hypothetical protein